MDKYAQLPEDMRETFATKAGVVLSDFDPESPGTAEEIRAAILFATTGGVNVSCVASVTDYGEDIDNCPKNTKEMADIESYTCSVSGTALSVSSSLIQRNLGSADVEAGTAAELSVIKPRVTVDPADFQVLWYVCPYGTQGGFVAIKLFNAYSTGGLSLQSSDRAKGQWSFAYTGYTSINTPEEVPMTFYIKTSDTAAAAEVDIA